MQQWRASDARQAHRVKPRLHGADNMSASQHSLRASAAVTVMFGDVFLATLPSLICNKPGLPADRATKDVAQRKCSDERARATVIKPVGPLPLARRRVARHNRA